MRSIRAGLFSKGAVLVATLVLGQRCLSGSDLASNKATDGTQPAPMSGITALERDLDFMVRTLEEVHPNLYAFTPKSVFQKQVAALRGDLSTPMTTRVFALRISRLVAGLKDGHTRVELTNDNTGTGLVFPLRLRKENGGIVAVGGFGESIRVPARSELVSINARPIGQIWDQIASVMSAEREAFKNYLVSCQIPLDLWNICQIDSPYSLEIVVPGHTQATRLVVDGIAYGEYSHALGLDAQAPPFEFEVLDHEKVGLLRFRRFENLGEFIPFLETMFSAIKKTGVSDLIVDLRENGGGNSILGDELLKYIIDKENRTRARVETKVSKQIIDWWEHGLSERFSLDAETKRVLQQEASELKAVRIGEMRIREATARDPVNSPLLFTGHLWVLTGIRTFSSASDLAAEIKDMKLGTLVGEETGGLASCYGDSYFFMLPNTQIEVAVSHKYFLRPGGFDDGRGVLPDHEVKADPVEMAKGNDAVLERTLELIRDRGQP